MHELKNKEIIPIINKLNENKKNSFEKFNAKDFKESSYNEFYSDKNNNIKKNNPKDDNISLSNSSNYNELSDCINPNNKPDDKNNPNIKLTEFENMLDSDGEINKKKLKEFQKKNIQFIDEIEHKDFTYEKIQKDFYKESTKYSLLTDQEITQKRHENFIKVNRIIYPISENDSTKKSDLLKEKILSPISDFNDLNIDKPIKDKIKSLSYLIPTPIQSQVIPLGLKGNDIIAISKTGSGKTFCYILPLIIHVLDQRPVEKGEGPIGIILSPTRELTQQISTELNKFAKLFSIKVCSLIGGENKTYQWKDIKGGSEILVATPGRIIDLVKKNAFKINSRCTFFIMDEADKLLDMGFEKQMKSISQSIRADRQTMIFSATINERIFKEFLSDDFFLRNNPVLVEVGENQLINNDIKQEVYIVSSEEEKNLWLEKNLYTFLENGQILIFSNQIFVCEKIYKKISEKFLNKIAVIHGDVHQIERTNIINKFRKGEYLILIATDLASRGLDINTISTVINYECPNDLETYIHRIGRTSRTELKDGKAITLFCNFKNEEKEKNNFFKLKKNEKKKAEMLIEHFQKSGILIPQELVDLCLIKENNFNNFSLEDTIYVNNQEIERDLPESFGKIFEK